MWDAMLRFINISVQYLLTSAYISVIPGPPKYAKTTAQSAKVTSWGTVEASADAKLEILQGHTLLQLVGANLPRANIYGFWMHGVRKF